MLLKLFICDRCGQEKEGFDEPNFEGTSGYYNMNSVWRKFKNNEKEEKICDSCMWKDPKYIKIYGRHI